MATPQKSRYGRVLKGSSKRRQILDDEESEDKQVPRKKILKDSLGPQGGPKKKMTSVVGKKTSKMSLKRRAMKPKPKRTVFFNSSDEASNESDLSTDYWTSQSITTSEISEDEQCADLTMEPLNLGDFSQFIHNYAQLESPICITLSSDSDTEDSGNVDEKAENIDAEKEEAEKEEGMKKALPRKVEMLVMKDTENVINVGSSDDQTTPINSNDESNTDDEHMRSPEIDEPDGILGTAPIDVAAHLKLLGTGLSAIGQRLIESEQEPNVSGVHSVLLDSLLCAVGPLLCLTTQIAGLENVPQDVLQRTLNHIAYFMPGL